MTETKKLVMVFKNSVGKNVSISIDDPKDNITETEIKTTMELIVEKNIFKKNDYAFVAAGTFNVTPAFPSALSMPSNTSVLMVVKSVAGSLNIYCP